MTDRPAPKPRKSRARPAAATTVPKGRRPQLVREAALDIPPPPRRARVADIAVVGAGPAGLAVALMLARQGRRVMVHERFATPRPLGAGFMLQPTGLHVLDRLGLTPEVEACGQRIDHIFGREARRGRVVLDVRYSDLKHPRPAIGIHRAAMFAILYEACVEAGVDFETDREIVRADAGRLIDSGGRRSAPFNLVIDASGARSAIAAGMGAERRDLAWGALWTTVPWPGAPFDPTALEQVYLGASRMLGVLPCGVLPGAPGAPLATFFWSLKTEIWPDWHALGLESWKDHCLRLWPELAPVMDAITDREQMTLASYGHQTLGRPVEDRLAVLGDAAHSTSPQLGQGVNMGLLDAQALADALVRHRDLPTALDAYARARRWHVRLYQALSLGFTPFYQADGRLLPWVRDHVLGKVARLPLAPRLLAATVAGVLLDPRSSEGG
ncbi:MULTISPECIES: NAD(P)/FAD-dependent oxidoreductase [unclassified Brevundimonas]|uniref:FAD-dependent oxidoreductase n=1 Tax=unclassified Brevundimonas TaxID=2622653 RepID=UPI000AEBBD0D|nr:MULTISPECIES: NAD(P)/FAD-dependent oxidoreductase [unclassified Brevundimonas]